MKLYLDLDGVLADFDTGANKVLGCDSHYKYAFIHGDDRMWQELHRDPDLFFNLPKMRDADWLWDNVRHLNPTILTALPKTNSASCDQQKRAWVAENFGIDVPVITCMADEKPDYCLPGDILVDDRTINAKKWANALGTFVWHLGARTTINALTQLRII